MKASRIARRVSFACLTAVGLAGLGVVLTAVASGRSFTFLHAGYTQELIGTSQEFGELYDDDGDGRPDNILGGVAFAPDGDPIVTNCLSGATTLHRFDLDGAASTVHETLLAPETLIPTDGGCGLVNHPDGTAYIAMHDGLSGIANVNPETGELLGFMGPPANALGIAVDPQTGHIIYAAADCYFTGVCSFINLDPVHGTFTTFATLAEADASFVDGMYFDPTGNYLFISNRFPVYRLTILDRTGALVQHVPMTAEPDGVAFHATEKFVVTNNIDGTMTKFDFPNDDYTQEPTQTEFASGGFRGDLLQVGSDGCIYLTQKGTRYNDDFMRPSADEDDPDFASPENSLVRICGGFAPPPGTPNVETGELPGPGEIGDFVWLDLNKDGVQDAGEPGISGVTVTVTDSIGASSMTTTDGNGLYHFTKLPIGTFTVTAQTPPGHGLSPAHAGGNPALDSDGPLATVVLATATPQNLDTDFGFTLIGTAQLSGFAYVDGNNNSQKDPSEAGIGGVTMTLGGANNATAVTAADGSYGFSALDAGDYSVTAPPEASGKSRSTPSPLEVTLAQGDDRKDVNFGYVPGQLSGFAYVDTNGNGTKDGGEPGIGGVTMTLSGGATTVTAGDGSYGFTALDAGGYSVTAPASAAGKGLATGNPLNVTLNAGQSYPNVNFGYIPGQLSGFAYIDANGNGQMDSGESGLGGVSMTLAGPQAGSATTGANGSYSFVGLLEGSYSVTAPSSAAAYTLMTPSPLSATVGAGQQVTDVNFGYRSTVPPIPAEFCSKASVKSVLDPATGRFPGNTGLDTFVHTINGESIQAAINAATDRNADGYIIVGVSAQAQIGLLGGNVTENITIDRVFPRPFALFACSVTVHDPIPGDGIATGRITAAASVAVDPSNLGIYVMDVHANDSAVAGWKVEGNGRYLRNVEARSNAVGVWLIGNNNTMHNGSAESNTGVGLLIQGNNNLVNDTDVMSNGNHGIQVVGDGNQILKVDVGEIGSGNHLDGINVSGASNLLSENDVFGSTRDAIRVAGNNNQLLKNVLGDKNKGNGGDGLHLSGAGNLVQENSAYANTGDGFDIAGGTASSANTVKKNSSGDKTKGNGGAGVLIAGAGNGAASPIEIEQNTVKSNGTVGIQVTGNGHQLKNNLSGGSASGETNVGCEFSVVAGNVNATGNKSNGTTVPGSNGSPFPSGCTGSP